jgi:4-diphosphocytidyl-2-C-methyl-D-erythritol kinase
VSGGRVRTVLAHAKINVGLAVLAREAGGFHQIETVFCRLELADEIEIATGGDGLRFSVAAPPEDPGPPPDLGPHDANLARRAAVAFHEATGRAPDVAIRLVKRIPAGGGLGGGSSDAAAVLAELNRIAGDPLPPDGLLRLGARLGSDVPFFLAGAPLALAWGRGTRLLPLPALPSAPVLLALPPVSVSTPEAYAALAATRSADHACPPAVLPAAVRAWEDLAGAVNEFEPLIFRRLPLLARVQAAVQDSGAVIARMTGTGSTIFGIYEDAATAARARDMLRTEFPETTVIVTRTAEGQALHAP